MNRSIESIRDLDRSAVELSSKMMREEEDCAVIAVAELLGLSYEEVHATMKLLGRKPKHATPFFIIENTVKGLGFGLEKVDPAFFIGKYPKAHRILKNITTWHPKRFPKVWDDGGRYLFLCKGHAFSVIKGVVGDQFGQRKFHVHGIYKLIAREQD